jgi:DNA-binding winged helix-turn-helix (wHTH) protein
LRYLFEEYVFDTDLRELRRGAKVISVAPQVFDLLDYLIRNRDCVVSKDDLIRTVWKGRIVSDVALTTRLNAVRSAIGDTGEKQHLIKTLPRKGFRFVARVQEDKKRTVEPVGSTEHRGDTTPTQTSAARLSIAIREPQRRSRAGLLCRWGNREPNDGLVTYRRLVRHWPTHSIQLQGQSA